MQTTLDYLSSHFMPFLLNYWLTTQHPVIRLPVFFMGICAGILCTRSKQGDFDAFQSKTNLFLNYYFQPKHDIPIFFKFLKKKVSRLDKKAPAHFYTVLGVVICKKPVARPLYSFNRCRKSLLSSLETFFRRNLKNVGMSFLGRCNVEVVLLPGF